MGIGAQPHEGSRSGIRTDIIVYSGAAVSAAPESVVGPSRAMGSRTFKTACGQQVTERGTTVVDLEFVDGAVMGAEFHVMDVTKPLASVAKLVDHGSWVIFRPE